MDLQLLWDIASDPCGALFLFSCFLGYLWYDTRKKLWAMVVDLEKKVEKLQREYDDVLKEKIKYQTLVQYTQMIRDHKDGVVSSARREH